MPLCRTYGFFTTVTHVQRHSNDTLVAALMTRSGPCRQSVVELVVAPPTLLPLLPYTASIKKVSNPGTPSRSSGGRLRVARALWSRSRRRLRCRCCCTCRPSGREGNPLTLPLSLLLLLLPLLCTGAAVDATMSLPYRYSVTSSCSCANNYRIK